MDQLAAIAAFVEVARRGGFAPAARALGLSTAQVSRRVAELEARWGATLFARTTRQVRLTETGGLLLGRATRILDDVARLDEEAGASERALEGPLRVTAPPMSSVDALAEAMLAFARAHPAIRLETLITERLVDLTGEGFDLAVRMGALASSSLIAKRLTCIDFALCASPGFLRRHGRPERPADIAALDAIVWPRVTKTRWRLTRGEEEAIVEPRARVAIDHVNILREAVLSGLGVASLPLIGVADHLAAGRLERVLGDWTIDEGRLSFVRPPQGRAPRKVAAFMAFVEDHLGRSTSRARDLEATTRVRS